MQESDVHLDFQERLPPIKVYGQLPAIEKKALDLEYRQLLDALVDKINPHFKAWEKREDFVFECPASTFAGGRDLPIIAYHQPDELNDQVEVQPLTEEQLASIKKDGTFFVKSKYFTIPYKWTISEWIYKGVDSILVQLKKDVAKGYMQLHELPKRVTSDFFSLKKGVIRLLKYVPNILNLLFGMRKGHYEQQNIETQLEFERQAEIYRKVWDSINKEFYDYVRVPISPSSLPEEEARAELTKHRNVADARLERLRKVGDIFQKEWVKVRDDIEERVAVDDIEVTRQRIKEEKYSLMRRLILEQGFEQNTDDRVKQDFLTVYSRVLLIEEAHESALKKTVDEVARFQTSIDEEYPIRKYAKNWRSDKVSDFREVREAANHQEFLLRVKDQLNLPIFNVHYDYLQNAEQRKAELQRTLPKTFVVNREFRCPYKLFPPYEVERAPSSTSPTGYCYTLIRQKNKYVSTSHFGWKTALNFVRWWTWSINVMYWLFRGVWGGRLGLKVLFGCSTFYPRYEVNQYTGQMGRSKDIYWRPIAVNLSHTWDGIARSRQQFEDAPDNGFFGKTCSRFCNLVENYVFRLIIVCFFWLLLIKPLIIVVNVVVCTLVAVTAILWIPIVILIYYLFGILFYNFDLDERYPSGRYSQRFFPLICGALKFVYDLLYTLGALLMLVMHPILAFLMLICSVIRFVGRSIYDRFMYCIIGCCGRSPVRDTAIAWKISGPGLSRQYFQSIREQDVYILLIAQLESRQLQHYEAGMLKKLRSLRAEASSTMEYLTQATKSPAYSNYQTIDDSIYFYERKLTMQLQKIRNKFPSYPGRNVRFTQAELTKYLSRSKEIVRSFVEKNRQQHLFDEMELKQGDYDRLTMKLWTSIFQSEEVFEPFENLDERFELADDREDEFVKGVMLAIEGTVDLREGSHVPMLKFKKKADTIQVHGPGIATQVYESFIHRSLPASRMNHLHSIFVNSNFPTLLAERQEQQSKSQQKTLHPLSVADEF